MSPEVDIFKVQAQLMNATSVEGFNKDLGGEDEGGDGGDALTRRRRDIWQDEDEEEEEY